MFRVIISLKGNHDHTVSLKNVDKIVSSSSFISFFSGEDVYSVRVCDLDYFTVY